MIALAELNRIDLDLVAFHGQQALGAPDHHQNHQHQELGMELGPGPEMATEREQHWNQTQVPQAFE